MKHELFYYQLDLKQPISIQKKKLTSREGFLLKLDHEDGSIGYGDICPLPSLSRESLKQVYDQLKQVDFSSFDHHRLFPSVVFGIQSAMKPIITKPFSMTYSFLCSGSFDKILSQIKTTQAHSLKIKVSGLTNTETAQVLQAAVQRHKKIRIDGNQKWSYEEALDLLNLFSCKDFEYIEEPCLTKQESLKLASSTGFPIALDESICEIQPFDLPFIQKIIFKPTVYPFFSWMKNKPIVYSSSFESGLGLYHILLRSQKHSREIPGIDTYKYLKEDVLIECLSFNDSTVTINPPILNINRLTPVRF